MGVEKAGVCGGKAVVVQIAEEAVDGHGSELERRRISRVNVATAAVVVIVVV